MLRLLRTRPHALFALLLLLRFAVGGGVECAAAVAESALSVMSVVSEPANVHAGHHAAHHDAVDSHGAEAPDSSPASGDGSHHDAPCTTAAGCLPVTVAAPALTVEASQRLVAPRLLAGSDRAPRSLIAAPETPPPRA